MCKTPSFTISSSVNGSPRACETRPSKANQLRRTCSEQQSYDARGSEGKSRAMQSPKSANQLRQLVAALPSDRNSSPISEAEVERQSLIARGEDLLASMCVALETKR